MKLSHFSLLEKLLSVTAFLLMLLLVALRQHRLSREAKLWPAPRLGQKFPCRTANQSGILTLTLDIAKIVRDTCPIVGG